MGVPLIFCPLGSEAQNAGLPALPPAQISWHGQKRDHCCRMNWCLGRILGNVQMWFMLTVVSEYYELESKCSLTLKSFHKNPGRTLITPHCNVQSSVGWGKEGFSKGCNIFLLSPVSWLKICHERTEMDKGLRHWIKEGQQRLKQAIEKWGLAESCCDSESSGCGWVWTPGALGWYRCRCNQDVSVHCKSLIRTSKEGVCIDVTLGIFLTVILNPWWF